MGAEGIGLCRTEHTLLSDEHKPKVAAMIMATDDRRAARAPGRPASAAARGVRGPVRRDGRPPGHRPAAGPAAARVPARPRRTSPRTSGASRSASRSPRSSSPPTSATSRRTCGELRRFHAKVLEIHEENPMLGTRGCRLGILYPEIYEMQVEALMQAVEHVRSARGKPAPHLEIMVPLVDYEQELQAIRELILERRGAALDDRGRGLLDRDDDRAAAGVLRGRPDRRARRVLLLRHQRPDADGARASRATTSSPSSCRSTWSAGSSTARRSRRSTGRASGGSCASRPGWGASSGRTSSSASAASTAGDPASIDFFHMAGLDYVSCSPFRVPVARVAAAQAAIRHADGD